MTTIVVGVRLNADGSGLVGQLRLSKEQMDQLTVAEKGAADAARDLTQATDQAAKAQARATSGTHQTSAATTEMTKNVGLARAGWQSFGFQIQDTFASAASGSRLSVIFAQQSGQMASAIAMIAQASEGSKGKLGGLATFLGGPWGIAIGIAVSAGSALVAMLLDADKAADVAKAGASGLGDAQSVLGDIFDLTSGKIKAQNALLVLNARLMAINLRSEAAKAKADAAATIQASDDRSPVGTASAFFARTSQNPFDRVAQVDQRARTARSYLDTVANAGSDAERRVAGQRALDFSESADFSGLSITAEEFRQAVIDQASSVAKVAIADAIDKSLDSGTLDPSLRRDSNRKTKKDTSADKAAREAERLAQFGERAADAVARLNDEYNSAPRDIDRARQATAQLDDVIGDVNKRLSTAKNLTAQQRDGFAQIRADAEKLKPVIEASLIRPIREMLDDQARQIEMNRLLLVGHQADAQALQLTWSLMDKMGVESEEQLATELAKRGVTEAQVRNLYDNLAVMRDQTREMRVQQVLQQAFLSSVLDMRENLRLTLESLRSDGPKAIGDFFDRSVDVLDRLFSEVATEKLFGSIFRDLEDQVTGADKVSEAGDKMAQAVGDAADQIVVMGKAAATATAIMQGRSAPSPGLDLDLKDVRDQATQEAGGADITVTANPLKVFKDGFQGGYEGFFDDLKGDFKDIFSDIFGDKGIFSESLGKTLGQLAGGAQTGATAGSLVTGILGVKGSSTGGAIGGAIGSAIAGPLGSIVGGALGSIAGGLVKSTPKASATVTGGSEDDVSVTGNKDSLKKATVGLASSVQETLAQIAEEFGGEVGRFAVSIGVRHGDYRVDTSGSGKTKKKSGAIDFDEDQAGAIAFAVMDAITDGGITGISAAVQKALGSSEDLDDALEEALKVREVEELLGGLGGELERQFKAFETQARERVRIASEYGFDVLAIEKKNAEDRTALIDQMLEEQVGSLQRLVAEMTSGSLFEGSAVEQRDAILVQIEKAKADLAAGKDGAADTLAGLLEQLNTVSEQAYGTTGQFAADRAMILNEANAAIAKARADVTAAASAGGGGSTGGSDPALATTNQALDENNEQNARLLGLIATLPAEIAALLNNRGYAPLDAAALARTS